MLEAFTVLVEGPKLELEIQAKGQEVLAFRRDVMFLQASGF